MILLKELPASETVNFIDIPLFNQYKIVTQNTHIINITNQGSGSNTLEIKLYSNGDSVFDFGIIAISPFNFIIKSDYEITSDSVKLYGVAQSL